MLEKGKEIFPLKYLRVLKYKWEDILLFGNWTVFSKVNLGILSRVRVQKCVVR